MSNKHKPKNTQFVFLKPTPKRLRFRFVSELQKKFRCQSRVVVVTVVADLPRLVVTTNRPAVQNDAVAFEHLEVGS